MRRNIILFLSLLLLSATVTVAQTTIIKGSFKKAGVQNILAKEIYVGTVDNGNRDAEGYGDGKGAGDAQLSVTPDFMALIDMDKDTRAGALRKVHFNGQNLWWSTKFNSWGGQFGLDDIPLIRISEIYLNRAEAYAHTDVPDSGVLEEVLLQRRIELAFEGHRFFDLKRLGKDIARPAGMPTIPYDDYRVVASIGTSELDVNTLLVNNPGY